MHADGESAFQQAPQRFAATIEGTIELVSQKGSVEKIGEVLRTLYEARREAHRFWLRLSKPLVARTHILKLLVQLASERFATQTNIVDGVYVVCHSHVYFSDFASSISPAKKRVTGFTIHALRFA